MSFHPVSGSCRNCSCAIELRVLEYSIDHYNFALCIPCQLWLKTKVAANTTVEAIRLYFSLKKRNVAAVLEKFDGHKRIDIAVADAKVNIEVDGRQYNTNTQQVFPDLQRTFYSFRKGYFTLRIPNALVINHLEETADCIIDFLAISKQRNALL